MSVSAVMLSGDVARRPLARIAIECFRRQTLDDRELVIVNSSGEPFELAEEPIREVMVSEKLSLGELRNVGLETARGDYVIAWDDDDWHHPERMARQLAGCDEEHDAVVLGSYVVLDLATGQSFGRSCRGFECGGCCGTILHRRTAHRYEARARGEDQLFVRAFQRRLCVLDEPPSLYVRTYSGLNVTPRKHVIDRPSQSARTSLSTADAALVREVARLYANVVSPRSAQVRSHHRDSDDSESTSAKFRSAWRRRDSGRSD